MTSLKECAGDVFLIIYFLICTFATNGYCDNNFNENYKETFPPRVIHSRLIDALTANNLNVRKNPINIPHITPPVNHQSVIKNYTSSENDKRNNLKCRCNITDLLSSKSTSITDCYTCIDSENEKREQDVGNNKLLLNYSQNKVNETIYLNVNFENLTDRQRRDVIDESSTSSNGLHGKWH